MCAVEAQHVGIPLTFPSLQPFLSRLLPPLCLTCQTATAGADLLLCERCDHALDLLRPVRPLPPPGISDAWAAAPHQGVARDLVAALKFRRLLPAATAAAELIAERSSSELLSGRPLVPVPPAALRHAWRGFDPAAELAAALAEITGASLCPCLRRRGSGPQRGRGRRERLANAPQIEATGAVPGLVVLIDDVLTTGATLAACAAALRFAGGVDVKAITFTHEL